MKSMWNNRASAGAEGPIRRVQFACLLTVLLMTLSMFLLEDRVSGVAYLLVERYMALPAMVFLGACLTLPRDSRRALYGGLAMAALFLANQLLHQLLEASARQIGPFLCAYILCLPFAGAAQDARRQRGLTWMAALFLTEGLLLTALAGLLVIGALPAFLAKHVYWDGNRLFAVGHPNICAALLMIGMALSAGFAFRSSRPRVRALLMLLMLPQFCAMSLTNGRATIIMTCLLLGGMAFCALRSRKKPLLALLAALVVMAGAFGFSRAVFHWNEGRLLKCAQTRMEAAEQTPARPEDVLVAQQSQGTLSEDLGTLNGRTRIWRYALTQLSENPRLKFTGTEYVDLFLSRGMTRRIYHTHNSWLEALYRMGLPGLAAALVITGAAVWNAAALLWRNDDLWKSCVALMMLALLGCAMLEPYLFVVDINYFFLDLLFLMCLGYTGQWRRQAPAGGGTDNVS